MENKKFDINERLIDLAVSILKVCDNVTPSKAGSHLISQLIPSGTSPFLNYG